MYVASELPRSSHYVETGRLYELSHLLIGVRVSLRHARLFPSGTAQGHGASGQQIHPCKNQSGLQVPQEQYAARPFPNMYSIMVRAIVGWLKTRCRLCMLPQ